MRLIDPKWMDLSIGYQLVQTLQSSLENEFDRAVDIGYKRKYRRELTEWQKKRRTFFAMIALLPLPFIALCISTFYFREVACVLAWWIITSLLAILAVGVAAGRYIIQMISGRPIPQQAKVAGNLTEHWWNNLSPTMLITKGKNDRREAAFLTSLFPHLNDEWLAVHNLFVSSQSSQYPDILLVGPSGIWIFEVVDWKGIITKQKGHWMQIQKNRREVVFIEQPDELWIHQKEGILDTFRARLPHLSWIFPMINGGIVFTNPKIHLDKMSIEGNTAPYGMADAWRERLINSVPDERLTQEVRLEILDMLFPMYRSPDLVPGEFRSARDEANRIYTEVVNQLREHVSKLVSK
jgi:hypothetical protein